MRTFTSLLLAFFVIPLTVQAATVNRTTIKKPTRGNYESVADEAAARRAQFFSSSSSVPRMNRYTSINHPFQFSYPDTWKVDDLSEKKIKGVVLSFISDGMSLKTMRNNRITLTVEPIAQRKDYSIDEINAFFMNRAERSNEVRLSDWYIPGFELSSAEDTTLFGRPARKFVYKASFASEPYTVIHYVASFNASLYKVQYAGPTDQFSVDESVFDMVFPTLKLKSVQGSVASSSAGTVRRRFVRSSAQSSRSSSRVRR